jgi:hypothetical protein
MIKKSLKSKTSKSHTWAPLSPEAVVDYSQCQKRQKVRFGKNSCATMLFFNYYTVKRASLFLSPAGMSPTKLSLAGYNLIIPDQGESG